MVHVRQQRNRFATLKTDHKLVSDEMERLMHIALAPPPSAETESSAAGSAALVESAPESQPPSSSTPCPAPAPPAQPPAILANNEASPDTPTPEAGAANEEAPAETRQPFAVVDIVTPASPAASAGLLVDDRIIAFGAVSLRSSPTPQLAMAALPGLMRAHENHSLDLIVQRGSGADLTLVTLSLTPQKWEGQGLLGCHVMPLQMNPVDSRYAPQVATEVALRANALPGSQ